MKRNNTVNSTPPRALTDGVLSDSLFVYRVPDENEKKDQHPWKLSRAECVLSVLKKRNVKNAADIGVNDMFYTNKIRKIASGNVYAVDVIFPENETIRNGIVCINDIEKLPENEFDCVVMMDVLEHIENDKLFFDNIVSKLKNNGTLLITVPAWQFLFSIHDIRSSHYRRYNRKQLLALLKHDTVKIETCHYFYTSLFLIRLLCLLKKDKFTGNDDKWNYSEKHILTFVIKMALNMDFWINKILSKLFIYLPGLSLLAVCRKI